MNALVVTGSRDLWDRKLVEAELAARKPQKVCVGCCPSGVDKITREWCDAAGVDCLVMRADWKMLGLRAGPARNKRMCQWGKANRAIVLAFPRGGKGTADCIAQAKQHGLTVEER